MMSQLQVFECSEPCGNAVVEGDLIRIWTVSGLKFLFVFRRLLTPDPDDPHGAGCHNLQFQIGLWIHLNAAELLHTAGNVTRQFSGLAKGSCLD
jgi:hypothetical protein